jgi:NAD+ synthase
MHKRGTVVAVSGGIDSAVCTALCARALGSDRVLGVMMPERDSSEDTLELSRSVCDAFVIGCVHEDITATLEAAGCYRRRDDAFRTALPEFDTGWRAKLNLPSISQVGSIRAAEVIASDPDGGTYRRPLSVEAYLQVVAATNFKQRVRKMIEYYYADLHNYAVVGTPNRLEYDQGFFVKNGDGAADLKPIAHLYKSQVYQLADALGVPDSVRSRVPTTDTYSLPQSQAEFFFELDYRSYDLCLYGRTNGMSADELAERSGLEIETIEYVYDAIDQKRRTTAYLHQPPHLVEEMP